MKTCPKCAEQVQDAAAVCRYCGHKFATKGSELGRLIGVVVAIFIVGWMINSCGEAANNAPISAAPPFNPQTSPSRFKRLVSPYLKDPASADVRIVAPGCGLVNARNSFGGMTGDRGMIVYEDDRVLLQDAEPKRFEREWKKRCG